VVSMVDRRLGQKVGSTREFEGWIRKWGARTKERSKAGPGNGSTHERDRNEGDRRLDQKMGSTHEREIEGWARKWGARDRERRLGQRVGSTREIERQHEGDRKARNRQR
jgi:hypothetical protein